MCSYNAVNGVPSCANGLFQNTVVRDEWGFDGYIVSEREREIEVWPCEVWLCTYPRYCTLSPIAVNVCDYMSVCMCVCMCIQVCMFFLQTLYYEGLFFSFPYHHLLCRSAIVELSLQYSLHTSKQGSMAL